MRAHTLTSYGPDGLRPAEIDEPVAGPGQVTVRVEHAAVNPLDWKIRHGHLADVLPLTLPTVIGTDLAGTVLAVGDGVDDLAPGDRVAGFADSGAFAAVAASRRERLVRVPDGLDLTTAVALVTAAETAQRVLGMIDLAPGSTVVVNGAAGSVGSTLAQLLLEAGHRVVGTASAPNHDYLRGLGAEAVDYGTSMLDELRVAAPQGVDAAFDTAGHDFVARMRPLVPAGRVVTIVDFAAAAQGAVVAGGDPTRLVATGLGPVLDRAARGTLDVRLDRELPFERLAEAVERSGSGHAPGKVLVAGPTA